MNIDVQHVVVAAGSGGTVAGLALGLKLLGSPILVHGVMVSDTTAYFYEEINKIFSDLGVSDKAEELVDIIDGWKGPGYDKNTPEELKLVVTIAQESGILLDSCYTLKAAKCMLEHPKFEHQNVLFVHTGGTFGLYSKLDQLPVTTNTF